MTTPPTVTKGTDSAGSTITGKVYVPAISPLLRRFTNARLVNYLTGTLSDGVSRDYYKGHPALSGTTQHLHLAFEYDDPVFEMILSGSGDWQMWVDDELIRIAKQAHTVSGSTRYCVKVDFGSRRLRKINLVIAASACAGFFIPPDATMQPLTAQLEPTIALMTDSYGQQAGSYLGYGLIFETAAYLGMKTWYADVVGGSGYAIANAGVNGGVNAFVDRFGLTTFSDIVPDVMLFNGGINDLAGLTSTQTAAVFAQARAYYPRAVIVATGPWCPNGTLAQDEGQKYPANNRAIAAGLAQIAGPWVYIDDLTGTWLNSSGVSGSVSGKQWLTGSGFGATSGEATISIATPGVVTFANAFVATKNQPVYFTTTGALPTGLTANTVYYVRDTGLSAASFQISATAGGAAINTSGTQSGVHTLTAGNRTGSSDRYIGPDGTHPEPAGVTFLSKMQARAAREGILAL